jgi:hypothetical protein
VRFQNQVLIPFLGLVLSFPSLEGHRVEPQLDDASLLVTVLASEDSLPLVDVVVQAVGNAKGGRSGANGKVMLVGLKLGRDQIRVTAPGRKLREIDIELESGLQHVTVLAEAFRLE